MTTVTTMDDRLCISCDDHLTVLDCIQSIGPRKDSEGLIKSSLRRRRRIGVHRLNLNIRIDSSTEHMFPLLGGDGERI